MEARTPSIPSIAGRMVMQLKQEIPGLTGRPSKTGLERMERWSKKAEMYRKSMEKNNLIPEKALNLLMLAESSMRVQSRSYKKVMKEEIGEDELEVKLYETEVNLTSCLYLLRLRESPEEDNPFFN